MGILSQIRLWCMEHSPWRAHVITGTPRRIFDETPVLASFCHSPLLSHSVRLVFGHLVGKDLHLVVLLELPKEIVPGGAEEIAYDRVS